MSLSDLAEEVWYGGHPLSYMLIPLSWFYRFVILSRKILFSAGLLPITKLSVPVIVVGNIAVGGTGKSPLTIWLAEHLRQKGRKPGIVSRGYGGKLNQNVQQVRDDSNPLLVGDEPLMIVRNTGCPVAIGKDRSAAGKGLIEHEAVDVIICDDGLQHLALSRDIEIAVLDGFRRHGNSRCLPAGPLREPVSRLKTVDMIVANNKAQRGEYLMEYQYGQLQSVSNPDMKRDILSFENQSVHGVCGIGSPEKFFSYLRRQNLKLIKHAFSDHHHFESSDLEFGDDFPIVMTEKDAVKCEEFANDRMWYLPIQAKLSNAFIHRLDKQLEDIGIG